MITSVESAGNVGRFFFHEKAFTNKLGTECFIMNDGRILDINEVIRDCVDGRYYLFEKDARGKTCRVWF